jgi:hypothetical protein
VFQLWQGKVVPLLHKLWSDFLRNIAWTNKWLNNVIQIFALFIACYIFPTLPIPETKLRSLEVLAKMYRGNKER